MKHIRIHKPRMAREHPWDEVLPADPRDPDVVRAKALARASGSRRPDSHHAAACGPGENHVQAPVPGARDRPPARRRAAQVSKAKRPDRTPRQTEPGLCPVPRRMGPHRDRPVSGRALRRCLTALVEHRTGSRGAAVRPAAGSAGQAELVMLTSQLTPNLSAHMPNVSPQGAGPSSMVTLPPAESLSQ